MLRAMGCPSCHGPSRPGERRCLRCGGELPPTCLACGQPVAAGEELCASCRTERMPLAEAPGDEMFQPSAAEETQVVSAPYPLAPRFIGREDAQAALVGAAARARNGTVFVALVGPPGSGKSRLVAELAAALEGRARVLSASAAPARGGYGPIARALAARFGVSEGATPAAARARIAAGVAEVLPEPRRGDIARLIAHALGAGEAEGDAERLEARTFLAIRRFLAADAAVRPIVLALDDLEQAGPETIKLLHYLAAGLGAAPILLLAIARQLEPGEPAPQRVELGGLSPDEAERLARELLRPLERAPEGLVAHARGFTTPRALVELVRWLLEAQVVVRAGGGWIVDESRLEAAQLPRDHQAITAARLALMPPAERDLLEKAASSGERFWLDALVAVIRAGQLAGAPDGPTLADIAASGDRTRLSVAMTLARLRDRDWIVEQPTSIPGAREYRFAYPPLRAVVAAGIAPEAARQHHLWLAQWLELRPEGRAEEALEEIAHHLELAGDRDQAAACYRRAADAARARYFNDRAIRLYARALGCAGEANLSARIHLWHDLGSVYELKGDYEAALAAFERMLRLTWVASSRCKAAVAFNKLGRVWRRKGDLKLALDYLGRGLALFQESGDERGVAGSQDDIGQVLYLSGRYDEALARTKAGLAGRSEPRSIAQSLSNLGNIHKDRGELDEAERCHRRALDLRRGAGDRAGAVLSLSNLAVLAFERGDRDAARRDWEQALDEAERIGAQPLAALVLGNLGETALVEGKPEEARRRLEEALALARELDDRRLHSEAARNLGLLELDAGNLARAEELAGRALTLAQASGLRDHVGRALLALGEIHAATLFDDKGAEGRAGADRYFKEGVEIFRAIGNAAELAKGLERFGRYRLEQGDVAGGRALLEEAREIFARLGLKAGDEVGRVIGEL
jgi:tetratricopeptide (TPR) repeat protein